MLYRHILVRFRPEWLSSYWILFIISIHCYNNYYCTACVLSSRTKRILYYDESEDVFCYGRYDFASPTRELLVKSVTLQIGTISVVFYMCGLVLSLIMALLEERITLVGEATLVNKNLTLINMVQLNIWLWHNMKCSLQSSMHRYCKTLYF